MCNHVCHTVAERSEFFKLFIALLQFPPLSAQFQVRSHARMDFFELEWLSYIVHTADGKRLDLVNCLTQRANEDDRYFFQPVVCFQLFAYFISIHLRHQDIQQDEIRRFYLSHLQRKFTTWHRTHLVSLFLQHSRKELQVSRCVIDEKNFC